MGCDEWPGVPREVYLFRSPLSSIKKEIQHRLDQKVNEWLDYWFVCRSLPHLWRVPPKYSRLRLSTVPAHGHVTESYVDPRNRGRTEKFNSNLKDVTHYRVSRVHKTWVITRTFVCIFTQRPINKCKNFWWIKIVNNRIISQIFKIFHVLVDLGHVLEPLWLLLHLFYLTRFPYALRGATALYPSLPRPTPPYHSLPLPTPPYRSLPLPTPPYSSLRLRFLWPFILVDSYFSVPLRTMSGSSSRVSFCRWGIPPSVVSSLGMVLFVRSCQFTVETWWYKLTANCWQVYRAQRHRCRSQTTSSLTSLLTFYPSRVWKVSINFHSLLFYIFSLTGYYLQGISKELWSSQPH